MSYTDDDNDDDYYRQTFLSPHERAFLEAELEFHESATVLEADLEFAYKLQLQEAINASLTPNDGASASSPNNSQAQTSRAIHDFHRRVHDHSVAPEAPRIPQRELARGSGEGSSIGAGKGSGLFRLYVKGLVNEEGVVLNGDGGKAVLSGIGVAICDERDVVVTEIRKPLIGNGSSKTAAEVKALIEGFNAALALEIKRLVVYLDHFTVYQFITGRWPPKQRKIALLINQAFLLRRKFTYCNTKLVARNDIKYAFRLARDAIISQITSPVESSQAKKINKTCIICLEDTNVQQMFSVDRCQHQYCFSCMKQHVEVKLLHGILPKCPHDGCKSELHVESCRKFLTAKLIETWSQRIREASIPVAERVYCPHPKCSALMSRTDVTEYAKDLFVGAERSGTRKCMKCHGLFCINCKVPWHSNLTCRDYKMLHPNPPTEDVKLKSLASRNLWRQCIKCNHMIELAEGCFHMTCRCGYEFCYNCGQEWKNKKPTCSCPLWTEDNIWHGEDRNFDNDEDDEDDIDEYDEYYESDSDENYLLDEYYFL